MKMDDEEKHILKTEAVDEENDAEEEQTHSSLPAASFNYVNSIVGSGVIGMAYALNQAGVMLGLVLIVVMGLVTDYSLVILIRASRSSGTHSYQGVMNAAFGTGGYILLSALQFTYPCIAMVSYNVIVGDTITKVLAFYAGIDSNSPWARRELIIALTTIFLSLPLSLHGGMAKFARLSLISLIVTVFVLCTIIIRYFTLSPTMPKTDDAWSLAKPGVMQAVAIASFAYMCHHSTFLLYGSLKQPSEERWARLTHASVFASTLLEIMYAIFGYATFTGFVQGDLLENYCRDDHLMNVSRLLFSVTILLTSPIECFVARDIIISTFFEKNSRDNQPTTEMNRTKILVTAAIVISTAIMSLSTDCLNIVLEFNGVLAAIPLAYILPAICYLRIEQSPWRSREKLPALFMTISGVGIMISSIFMIFINWKESSNCSHGVEMSYCTSMFRNTTG